MSHGPFGRVRGTLDPAPVCCASVKVGPVISASASISARLIVVFIFILCLADLPASCLVALRQQPRFPEREEYVINTSEFNRVKARLLRLSNARATTAGEINNSDQSAPGRPTLKRRQTTPDDTPQPTD